MCGRQANSTLSRLGDYLGSSKQEVPLVDDLKRVLQFALDRISTGTPVVITPALKTTWLFFTDGACEEHSSVGGTLIHPNGKPIFYFGSVVPSDLEEILRAESKHPIYEVEILAVVIAVILWGRDVVHSQTVFYLDNDAARSGFVRGVGATHLADVLIRTFCQIENNLLIRSWFSRVPSFSNLGDDPSRLDFRLLNKLGAKQVSVPWPCLRNLLVTDRLDVGTLRGLKPEIVPIA